MEIISFALGYRFDPIYGVEKQLQEVEIISRLISAVDKKYFAGMKLYAGTALLDENDDENVVTLVFTGCGLKKTRRMHYAIMAKNSIVKNLTEYRGVVQTNAVLRMDTLPYYGEFDNKGVFIPCLDRAAAIKQTDADAKKDASQSKEKITILLAPDKFKGTLDQKQVIKVLKAAAREAFDNCRFISLPAADGGDGTGEILSKQLGGYRRTSEVTAPYGETITSEYYLIGGDTAVIEMARASGLAIAGDALYPLDATSRGTGELILAAVNAGATKILLCVGGSATNDGGIGAASALGVRFVDDASNELEPCAGNMSKIAGVDLNGVPDEVKNAQITVLCDVNNPLTGKNGATLVFGAQKGADKAALELLERGMKNLECVYDAHAGYDICSKRGMGAAGGIAAMFAALFGAKIESGSKTVLDELCFDMKAENADLIVTGEGSFDAQSLHSDKLVGEVLDRAKKLSKKTAVIAGTVSSEITNLSEEYPDCFTASSIENASSVDDLRENAEKRLYDCAVKTFLQLKNG